jgi:hypothetical protein
LASNPEDAVLLERVWEEEDLTPLLFTHCRSRNFPETHAGSDDDLKVIHGASMLSEIPEDTFFGSSNISMPDAGFSRHGELILVLMRIRAPDYFEEGTPAAKIADAIRYAIKLLRQKQVPIHRPVKKGEEVGWWMACASSVNISDFERAIEVAGTGIIKRARQVLAANIEDPNLVPEVPESKILVGAARSNYFHVNDAIAFRAWASTRDLKVWNNDDAFKPQFAIVPGSSANPWSYISETGFWPTAVLTQSTAELVDIPTELARHLAEGSVAVLQQIRSVPGSITTADALAINNKAQRAHVSIDEIYEKAKTLGGEIIELGK